MAASRNFFGGFLVTKLSLPLASQRGAGAGSVLGRFLAVKLIHPRVKLVGACLCPVPMGHSKFYPDEKT